MLYVMYNIAPQQKGSENSNNNPGSHLSEPPQDVLEFLNTRQPQGELVGSYTEVLENRRNVKWPELQKALACCRQKGASLLIAELGILASNESFTEILLASNVTFHCLDQPFVNQTILEALSKHAKVQKNLHGQLIREGLKMTSAKSGNPNAAEVISKVNKPKIDTAIVFAFLLQLIIQDYRRKGYSQRHMVKTLNEEGFTAPEGGKWVLSQLQKVLDRVRLNEIATEVKQLSLEWAQNASTPTDIVTILNTKAIAPLKPPLWDESQVKKLQDRIRQIKEITLINGFVLLMLPLLHEYQDRALTPNDMIRALEQSGLPVRQDDTLQNDVHSKHSHPEKQNVSSLHRLKQILFSFHVEENILTAGSRSLECVFESAAKHMPVYLKIIKGHIEQLAKVLELETHSHRNLENAGLAEPVLQLMQLFRELKEEDIQLLETLARETQHWPRAHKVETMLKENALTV
jgi:hypothetical protein